MGKRNIGHALMSGVLSFMISATSMNPAGSIRSVNYKSNIG